MPIDVKEEQPAIKSEPTLVTALIGLKSIDVKLVQSVRKLPLIADTFSRPDTLTEVNAAQLETKSAPTSVTTIPERSSDNRLVQPLTKWAPID